MNAVKHPNNRLVPVRFENLFDEVFNLGSWAQQDRWTGPMAAWEDKDHLHVELEAPGVEQSDIELVVNDGKLLITWERKPYEAAEGEHRKMAFDERRYGRFQRAVSLPKTVDQEHVEAELKNGILRISFRKKPELLPRKIEVKVS